MDVRSRQKVPSPGMTRSARSPLNKSASSEMRTMRFFMGRPTIRAVATDIIARVIRKAFEL